MRKVGPPNYTVLIRACHFQTAESGNIQHEKEQPPKHNAREGLPQAPTVDNTAYPHLQKTPQSMAPRRVRLLAEEA
ncbi:hypothetical protein K239x_03130 [Planctomycetes bacterium K23_9]|uniref:Uncharacterized protein n=1 Tax=Stieleria marina TaxID=1930275 RepID=A0A517NML1_9BACT|nr:hypothetical protein K239x_03130 [Planctomycetes bacterium K23_9]